MKILHISTHDIAGGAARAAYRLHQGLLRLGHDSRMLVCEKHSTDATVTEISQPREFSARLGRMLRALAVRRGFERYRSTRPEGFEVFSDARSQFGRDLVEQLPECDVINLHWISGYLDYRDFFPRVSHGVPVVCSLHDMNFLTGGCHYDHGCGRFAQQCGACPQLGSRRERDLSRKVWGWKQRSLAAVDTGRFHVVANSRWMAAEARRSSLTSRFQVSTIHLGLDVDVYKPRDRRFARSVFGVPMDAKVLLFAADSITNRRKGFALLVEAIAGLKGYPGLFLLSVGHGETEVTKSINHRHLSIALDDRFLSLVYSAADVLVIPSLQEAFGQTALEAMSCETPVVGFDVGGIPDMIQPHVTGLLARPGDVASLRDSIVEMLDHPHEGRQMGVNGRAIVKDRFSLEHVARRYEELYRRMTGRAPAVEMLREMKA